MLNHLVTPFQPKYSSRVFSHLGKVFLCLFLICLFGCKKKGEKIQLNEEVEVQRESFSFSQTDAPYDLLHRYSIQPGDVLDVLYQIQTWIKKDTFKIQVDHTIAIHFVDTPDLDQNQNVLPDGYITLPFIGKYLVEGKSLEQIQTELKDLYKGILRDPDIYVTVPEFRTAIREFKQDLHTAPRGLSRLVTVRPDGYVTFPMVGELMVAFRTITQVNEELNKKYNLLISGLHVDLFLEKHSGSLIYMLGEVVKPGQYPILKPVTVPQGLALAEGHKPSANLRQVVVVRKHEGKMIAKVLDLKESAIFGGRGSLFYLQPDDIVYVPKRKLSQWADVVKDIQEVLFFRGWGVSLSHDPFESSKELD